MHYAVTANGIVNELHKLQQGLEACQQLTSSPPGKVISLSWDPKGPRFAVIQGEQGRTDVSFFKIGEKILPIGKTLVNKKCSTIKWSPLGSSYLSLVYTVLTLPLPTTLILSTKTN